MTKANELWEAEMKVGRIEDELFDLFEQHKIPWSDYTSDITDSSIEIYGMAPGAVLSVEQQQALWRFGFWQAWTHTAKRHDPANEEHHYGQCIYKHGKWIESESAIETTRSHMAK